MGSFGEDGRGGKGRIWKSLLKRIERRKLKNAGEGVEGPPGFLKERGICEVGRSELGAVVILDPAFKVLKERLVEEEATFDGGFFGLGKDDPLAEAGGPATVAHAFTEIKAEDLVDRDLRIGEPVLEKGVDGGGFRTFLRGDEEEAFFGEAEELAVEEVGPDGLREAEAGVGNLDEAERGTGKAEKSGRKTLKIGAATGKGSFVRDEDVRVTNGDDIIMEDPRINGGGGLLEIDDLFRIELVEAGEGANGFEGLAGGKADWLWKVGVEGATAINKEVETFSGRIGEAGMVGSPFVGHGLTAREG